MANHAKSVDCRENVANDVADSSQLTGRERGAANEGTLKADHAQATRNRKRYAGPFSGRMRYFDEVRSAKNSPIGPRGPRVTAKCVERKFYPGREHIGGERMLGILDEEWTTWESAAGEKAGLCRYRISSRGPGSCMVRFRRG
jgi:hypothetical protein